MSVLWCTTSHLLYYYFSFQPVDKESDLFNRLVTYVKNTHAATHTQYSLEVLDVSEYHLYSICNILTSVTALQTQWLPMFQITLKCNVLYIVSLFVSLKVISLCPKMADCSKECDYHHTVHIGDFAKNQ